MKMMMMKIVVAHFERFMQATSYEEIAYEEVADALRRTYGYSPE